MNEPNILVKNGKLYNRSSVIAYSKDLINDFHCIHCGELVSPRNQFASHILNGFIDARHTFMNGELKAIHPHCKRDYMLSLQMDLNQI